MKISVHDKPVYPSYRILLLICCGITFLCCFASYMRLPVVPLYARSLGMNTAQIGIINAAFFLTAGLLSFPLSIVSDRLGRKRLASSGLLILSASSFLLCFGETFPQMAGIYLIFGIGMAGFGPTMMTFVADVSPPTHLGRSYGWYTTALFCGMSLGPALGGFMAQEMGFTRVFLIAGAIIFLDFWMLIFFMPFKESAHASGPEKRKTSVVVRNLFKNHPLMGCWLATLGGCFGLGMFITFISLHAQNQGLNAGQIGLVFFAQGLCNAASRIPFGYLSDKVGNRSHLVITGLVGFALSMIGFGASENMSHFIIFAMTLGGSMGLAFTSVGALIAESVPLESRGPAMGGYNTCIYFGMMLSSASMGPVIQMTSFKSGFFITALIIFFLISLFYFLMKDASRV